MKRWYSPALHRWIVSTCSRRVLLPCGCMLSAPAHRLVVSADTSVGRRVLPLRRYWWHRVITLQSWLSLGYLWLWVHWLLAEYFLEWQRGCLCKQLVHLEEKVAEVELTAPLWVILPIGPVRDEVVLDPIVLFHVVEQLDDSWVRWLVQVDVRRHDRILSW